MRFDVRHENSIKLFDQGNDIGHDRYKNCSVAFNSIGDITPKCNPHESLAVCNDVQRLGACITCILKGSAETKSLRQHTVVVVVLWASCAFNVGLTKVMMVIDEGKAHHAGVRHKAAVKDTCSVDTREDG